jgi:hypothetical protein
LPRFARARAGVPALLDGAEQMDGMDGEERREAEETGKPRKEPCGPNA